MSQTGQSSLYLVYLLHKAEPPEEAVLCLDEEFVRVLSLNAATLSQYALDDCVVERQDTRLVIQSSENAIQTVLESINADVINESLVGTERSDIEFSCTSGDAELQIIIKLGAFYLLRKGNLMLKEAIGANDQVLLEGNSVSIKSLAYSFKLVFLSEVDSNEVHALLQFCVRLAAESASSNGAERQNNFVEQQECTVAETLTTPTRKAEEVGPLAGNSLNKNPQMEDPELGVSELQELKATSNAGMMGSGGKMVTPQTNNALVPSQTDARSIRYALKALNKDFDAKIVSSGEKIIIAFVFENSSLLATIVAKCEVLYERVEVTDIQIVDQQKRRVIVKLAPIEEQLEFGLEFADLYRAWTVVSLAEQRGINVENA